MLQMQVVGNLLFSSLFNCFFSWGGWERNRRRMILVASISVIPSDCYTSKQISILFSEVRDE